MFGGISSPVRRAACAMLNAEDGWSAGVRVPPCRAMPVHPTAMHHASDRVWATVLLEGGSDGVYFDAPMVVKHGRQSKSTVISLFLKKVLE